MDWVALIVGIVIGLVVAGVLVWQLMPGMMLVTRPSALGYDETVETLQATLEREGWSSPGLVDIQQSMAKKGVEFPHRVRIVQLCKAPYAKEVLTDARHVSSMMPCAISVWEDDGGKVFVSKMNTGLMGKMFGGVIARVMGGKVAPEEHRIIESVCGPDAKPAKPAGAQA